MTTTMKIKIFLFVIVGIFLISMISAQLPNLAINNDDISIGIAKQELTMQLTQTCSNCTYVNLTKVLSPNQDFILLGQFSMTKNGTNFNYTFSNTHNLGIYYYTTCGDLNGVVTCQSINFEVTPTGFVGTLGFYILILILSLGIVILGFSIHDSWVGILGSLGLVMAGLFIILFGIDGMKDIAYTWAFGIITIMLGSYLGVRGALENVE